MDITVIPGVSKVTENGDIEFFLWLSVVIVFLISLQTWIVLWQTKRSTRKLIQTFYEINKNNNKTYIKLRDEILDELRYIELHLQELQESKDNKELDSSRKTINTHLNSQSNTTYNNRDFSVVNSHQEQQMKNPQAKSDYKFNILLKAYQKSQVDEKFIPLLEVIDNLIVDGLVNSEQEAKELIVNLTKKYPSSILIENVRGKLGKQIAIIW